MQDERHGGGEVVHLENEESIRKMQELVRHNNICLFTTELSMIPLQTRPMATQEVDDEGNFWFLSSRQSNKNFEVGDDSRVQLFYANKGDVEFLSVYGHAEIYKDSDKIEQHWTPMAKAWFQEGKSDPDLTVIKVTPEDVYYWDTKSGKAVSLIKIMASVVGNRTMDDGVEGKLKV
jgi:general stress protein 26